ncbi:hypothetical protein [Amycolatopsis sp. PS_44_ISF1]|uniref:hypothetical protein n=1 Tax=Amycolatopsis sp. PS_44_ISF1 TaxID=2974917 RepID=UPI0028DEE385|nr:hypothetical protein [Amycolatopsis sp. PS_44_ISF1]MDT8913868.1 hypothetical protein [Amycolatopsis sp. PS_44_ISF1]
MAGSGFTVNADELHEFSGYLSGTTAPAVKQAAGGVHGANGFDNQAFGILLAQILAVPARIAMGVVAGNLDQISADVSATADSTKKAAEAYTNQDRSASDGLGIFKAELKA